MSYLSLLCASHVGEQWWLTEASRAAESAAWTAPKGAEATGTGAGASRTDDYELPSGVHSIQHWLDLNA
jgi:hypothetical protein